MRRIVAAEHERVVAVMFAKDWSSTTWAEGIASGLGELGPVWWHASAAGVFLLRSGASDDEIGAALHPLYDAYGPHPYVMDVTSSDFATAGIPDLDQWLVSADAASSDVGASGARRPDAVAQTPYLECAQRHLPLLSELESGDGTYLRLGGGGQTVFEPPGWTVQITEMLAGYFDPPLVFRPPPPDRDQQEIPDLRYFTVPLDLAQRIGAIVRERQYDYDHVDESEYPGAGEYLAIAEMSGQAAKLHGFVVTAARADERVEFREISIPLVGISPQVLKDIRARVRRLKGSARSYGGKSGVLAVYLGKR